MKIAAIIIGIDNWDRYTKPLMDSLFAHEPSVRQVVIDNASSTPYPVQPEVWRTERLCYSAAINYGKRIVGDADWYIVLSNDVLCTGPFANRLAAYETTDVVGPLLKETPIQGMGNVPYIEGWCVCIPRNIWDAVGGWDEGFQVSSFEDVDFSTSAREKGFFLAEDTDLPFKHLDQRQRFTLIPNYWDSEVHNYSYFVRKHGGKA